MTIASIRQLARFSMVGLLATGIHVAVAWLAYRGLAFAPAAANAAGFVSAFMASYFGHHHWSFRRQGNHDIHLRRFLVVSLVAFLDHHVLEVFDGRGRAAITTVIAPSSATPADDTIGVYASGCAAGWPTVGVEVTEHRRAGSSRWRCSLALIPHPSPHPDPHPHPNQPQPLP